MAVRRIVANIATNRLDAATPFDGDLLGMNIEHESRVNHDLCGGWYQAAADQRGH
jgi:hypothetical protein